MISSTLARREGNLTAVDMQNLTSGLWPPKVSAGNMGGMCDVSCSADPEECFAPSSAPVEAQVQQRGEDQDHRQHLHGGVRAPAGTQQKAGTHRGTRFTCDATRAESENKTHGAVLIDVSMCTHWLQKNVPHERCNWTQGRLAFPTDNRKQSHGSEKILLLDSSSCGLSVIQDFLVCRTTLKVITTS